MQMMKFPIIIFLIFISSSICRAEIIISNHHLEKKTSDFVEGVTILLKSCYVDRIKPVALAGELPDTLFRKVAIEHSISVVLIDRTTRSTSNQHRVNDKFRQFRYELQVFIVGVSSVDNFIKIMQEEITRSIWWNNRGSFVILDLGDGCKNYVALLGIAWQLGILDATVMCFHRERGILIFNYNPYTNEAPSTWKRIFNVPGIDDHPFTIFYRTYGKYEDICKNLHFEKTKNLGGYNIRTFRSKKIEIAHKGSLQTSAYHNGALRRVFNIISRVMNATLIRNIRKGKFLDEDYDELQEVPSCMINIGHHRMAYPHDRTGVVLISQFRGHKSQLNKIISVLDVSSRIGLAIVYLITFIFFRFFLRQASMRAILNLVRITCDKGFENISKNNPTRIYLSVILFFAVTIQGIYQGTLASLLTRQIPLPSVNTLNDTVDFGYHIYGDKTYKLIIDNREVIKRYIEIDKQERCVEYSKNDSLGVCIGLDSSYLLDQARELKMHVSTQTIVPLYVAFQIKWDWPLEVRFNELIQKMFEADVLKPWPERFNATKLTEFEYDDKVMKNKDFKNIQLHEVLFAFIILGIGLVCATITFIGELVVHHRFRSRVKTVKVQILNSIQLI